MARQAKTRASSGKTKQAELPGLDDPRAELDSAAFLRAAQPVLRQLDADLLARAKASPAVTRALQVRHAFDKQSKRTADNLAQWQQNFVGQVGAAWLLSCVFVRTLEDRGLLNQARIAGPGAADSQRLFFELAPSLNERDYLLTVFRELSHFPAARDLFDAKHNPVWLLAPSAEAANALLHLFRTPSADTPAFRFGQPDTRFLGDLYQDLDDNVRKRFALLQTPRFVESFILDRTLEPAIEKFGLDDTTLIDPTCGSGHFLLGAFERLFEHRQRSEPGLDVRQAAHKALDAVFGVDINPYAVAIARFRLALAFFDKAGITTLKNAPELPLHLVVADSLLHNPRKTSLPFDVLPSVESGDFGAHPFALEDAAAARDVLYRDYAVVVGNPPYITVKDAALRDTYRQQYVSAAGKYSLAAPFAERFFDLGRKAAAVGMITANSFMKREFGKKLIEQYLPTTNLETIVNTSGAYIPGHGTPTVLLFGTAEEPSGSQVLTVLANRGEPTTPEDPKQGHVWRSIAEHWSEVGFENEYITVTNVERDALAQHPWSLSGGGAVDLKELLESRADSKLDAVAGSIGIASFTLEDDVFLRRRGAWLRLGVSETRLRPMVIGEQIRDWGMGDLDAAFFPYGTDFEPIKESEPDLRHLWPWRTNLANNKLFGAKTKVEGGLKWYEFGRLTADKLRTPLSITFAFVATHNHFVLDRGGKVFKQSAPIIKLPEDATEDDHYALLAYLNSSTACFWMKQVMHNKTNASQKHTTDPARAAYEFAGAALEDLPVFRLQEDAIAVSRELVELGGRRSAWLGGDVFRERAQEALSDNLTAWLAQGWAEYDRTTRRAVYLQEELDWAAYVAAGLVTSEEAQVRLDLRDEAPLGSRPFERESGYDAGVSSRAGGRSARTENIGASHWTSRAALTAQSGVRVVEAREFKRMWRDTESNVAQEAFRRDLALSWIRQYVTDQLEVAIKGSIPQTIRQMVAAVDSHQLHAAAKALGAQPERLVSTLADAEAVPFLDTLVYTSSGLEKRTEWCRVWELQRRQDAGVKVDEISVPPPYSQGSRGKSRDFRGATYWRLRGKLDVPKERFISYPGCESDEDGEPLYGWAGWDHLQRMQALAGLYQERKSQGWKADKKTTETPDADDRLIPMLAGLLELLPWVKQWHNEPSDEFDGLRLGDYFENFINAQCRELGLTHDDLRAWRPSARPTRRNKRKSAT